MTHIFHVGQEVEWDDECKDKIVQRDLPKYKKTYGDGFIVTDIKDAEGPAKACHPQIIYLKISTLGFYGMWFRPVKQRTGFSLGEIV